MRLKFRADLKDVIIFSIFAVAWLLIVSVAVTNVSAFLNGDEFTLNPLLGFSKQNLAATMVFFIVGLIAAFAGVKSIFLEKEDSVGVGISIGQKREKNYARWSKPNEIKHSANVVFFTIV